MITISRNSHDSFLDDILIQSNNQHMRKNRIITHPQNEENNPLENYINYEPSISDKYVLVNTNQKKQRKERTVRDIQRNLEEYIHSRDTEQSRYSDLTRILSTINDHFQRAPTSQATEYDTNILDFRRLPETDEFNMEQMNASFHSILEYTKKFATDYERRFFDECANRLTCGFPNHSLANELERFQTGFTDNDFRENYIVPFLKKDVILPEAELTRFGLSFDIRRNNSQYGKKQEQKYFDTTFNFCLTYDNELIASVGFDVRDGQMFIGQIQGIRGNGDLLSRFKWTQALVRYAIDWAELNEVPQVCVISVDNNEWANKHGHLKKEQGKMLYDVTARRLGFKNRDENGNYIMDLQPRLRVRYA